MSPRKRPRLNKDEYHVEKIVDVHQRSLEYIDQNTTEITQSLAGVQHSVSRGSNFDAGGYGY